MRLAHLRRVVAGGVALLVVGGTLLLAAVASGGSFTARAPSSSAPPWLALSSAPAVYDAATGYDLWYVPVGATWTYANGSWSNITPVAGIPRDMGDNVRMVYDAHDGYVLLFGGAAPARPPAVGEAPLNDSWKFQDGRWTNLTSAVVAAPSARNLGLLTYDTADHLVVLYGGFLPGGSPGNVADPNETWTYTAGTWTNATVPGPPPVYVGQATDSLQVLVDDPAAGYVLFYDALGPCPSHNACPVEWTYHAGVWTNRTAGPAPVPYLPLFVMVTYDTTTGSVLALATCVSTAAYACSHSVGTFVYADGTWTDVTPSSQPTFRFGADSVDDPADGGVLLAGGCCWGDFSGLNLPWQDAWVYAHGSWTESEPWGGGTPSWIGNDGSWLAVGILGSVLVTVVFSARSSVPRRPR